MDSRGSPAGTIGWTPEQVNVLEVSSNPLLKQSPFSCLFLFQDTFHGRTHFSLLFFPQFIFLEPFCARASAGFPYKDTDLSSGPSRFFIFIPAHVCPEPFHIQMEGFPRISNAYQSMSEKTVILMYCPLARLAIRRASKKWREGSLLFFMTLSYDLLHFCLDAIFRSHLRRRRHFPQPCSQREGFPVFS